MSKSKVAVIGLGEWGSAIAEHLLRLEIDVLCYSRSEKYRNKKLTLCSDIKELQSCTICVLALPSQALPEIKELIQLATTSETLVVSALKGLHPVSHQTPLQWLNSIGFASNKLCVFSGPSFASDLAAGRPVSLVAASASLQVAELISKMFSGSTTRVYSSSDPLGVELGGIIKNVIAIAAGISDGLELGPSARAAVITRGLFEILGLAVAQGADPQTLYGLSGLGDLVMTSTDDRSRNRRVGLGLGRGYSIEKIVSEIGAVAEGAENAERVLAMATDLKLEVPITKQVVEVIKGFYSPAEAVKALLSRPIKNEAR